MLKWWIAAICVAQVSFAATRTERDEQRIQEICQSTDPVLVIDTFDGIPSNRKIIDLNGDGQYDVHHGELVEKILQLNHSKTLRHNIHNPIYSEELYVELLNIVEKIESGELRVSAINFSQGYEVNIASLNSLLEIDRSVEAEIDEDNVHLYGERIIKLLGETRPRIKFLELNDIFLRLQAMNVPVVIAASNAGWQDVNIYSLFPGVISVGSINLEGKKASYSSDNSAITIWRQGDIESFAEPDGIDLNADRIADFDVLTPRISAHLAQNLAEMHIDDVLLEVPDEVAQANDTNRSVFFDLIKKLPKGVYKTRDILNQSRSTNYQNAEYMHRHLGQYFYLDGIHELPLLFFKIGSSGELRIDVENFATERQKRNVLMGTSFSAPNICNGTITPERFAQD